MDSTESILELIEKEEQEFQSHWVWKELPCSRDEFFEAIEKHSKAMASPEVLEEKLRAVKDAARIRSSEKRAVFRPLQLKLIGALRA